MTLAHVTAAVGDGIGVRCGLGGGIEKPMRRECDGGDPASSVSG